MNTETRFRYLQLALIVFGLIFIFGVYPLTVFWPSGWLWHHGHREYINMIMVVYAVLGVFLLLASRDPGKHLGLISFTIWSSVAHAVVMGVMAVNNPVHTGHLTGDIPALFIIAVVLGWLCPNAARLRFDGRIA